MGAGHAHAFLYMIAALSNLVAILTLTFGFTTF